MILSISAVSNGPDILILVLIMLGVKIRRRCHFFKVPDILGAVGIFAVPHLDNNFFASSLFIDFPSTFKNTFVLFHNGRIE